MTAIVPKNNLSPIDRTFTFKGYGTLFAQKTHQASLANAYNTETSSDSTEMTQPPALKYQSGNLLKDKYNRFAALGREYLINFLHDYPEAIQYLLEDQTHLSRDDLKKDILMCLMDKLPTEKMDTVKKALQNNPTAVRLFNAIQLEKANSLTNRKTF